MQITPERLARSRGDRMIAGVAGGIARYLKIDPALVRLAFVALAFTGIGVLLYPLLWLVMPLESATGVPFQAARVDEEARQVYVGTHGSPSPTSAQPAPRFDPLTGEPLSVGPIAQAEPSQPKATNNSRMRLLGYVLLAIGGFLLLNLLVPGAEQFIFPAVLIAVGVLLLRRKAR